MLSNRRFSLDSLVRSSLLRAFRYHFPPPLPVPPLSSSPHLRCVWQLVSMPSIPSDSSVNQWCSILLIRFVPISSSHPSITLFLPLRNAFLTRRIVLIDPISSLMNMMIPSSTWTITVLVVSYLSDPFTYSSSPPPYSSLPAQCYAPYITQYIAVEKKQLENELDRIINVDLESCQSLCTQRLSLTVWRLRWRKGNTR